MTPTLIHVEDDSFIRYLWKKKADEHKLHLLSFANFNDLNEKVSSLEKTSVFYLDHALGEGELTGLEIAKTLYEQGFKNINLSTGYDDIFAIDYFFINKIYGKRAPEEDWEKIISKRG